MKQSSSSSISMKSIFTLLAFIFFITVLYAKDFSYIFRKHLYHNTNFRNQRMSSLSANERTIEKLPFAIGEADKWCDVFSGRWVHDSDQRPLYEESECPYIVPQLTCQQHGRPDKNYQQWRWQPHGCSLPSFNAALMLKSLRGKRMMFIGDSLNRNQYISMICLLQKIIPKHARSMETFGSLTIFTAKDYNATIEFYWAPFLLESNSDDAHIHRLSDRIVRKDSMNKHGKHWQRADILVFNTYLWWISMDESNILQGSFDDKVKEIKVVPLENAYRMAMNSFIKWINKNINPKKTRVFFISMSPTHEVSMEWRGDNNMKDGINGSCYNERSIIEDPTYWGSSTKKMLMQVISEEFMKSKVPITFLNITQLSNYRKDAHTSIYKKQWKPLNAEQLANPVMYADCVHWCLPGLPDTWNELLFSNLFYPSYSF